MFRAWDGVRQKQSKTYRQGTDGRTWILFAGVDFRQWHAL